MTDPNDFSDTPTLPASDINSSIGFKNLLLLMVKDHQSKMGTSKSKPEDVDKEERSPVPPETNKVSQKSQSELVDLYYPVDLNVEETDYLLIKSSI